MIYYRIVQRYDRKTHWKLIEGASNLRDGVVFMENNFDRLKTPNAVNWEVGCKVPPRDTPQARRSGPR